MEDMEQIESTENTDAIEPSSEAPEDSSNSGEPAKAAAPETKQETEIDWAKAFEHPRFKELIEQKNAERTQRQELERKLLALETRYTQQPQAPTKEQSEVEALINDLKQIDPRLAATIEAQTKAASRVEEIQKRLEGFEKQAQEQQRQTVVKEAISKINQMHESNKVSPEVKELINEKLDLLYMRGKLSMDNLEGEYKNVLDAHTKYIEAVKRAERESYVQAKKKDAAVPTSQPKGTPAKAGTKKPSWSSDKELAREQIVSRFLKQQAANRDADSV